jgi:hypothetical protein
MTTFDDGIVQGYVDGCHVHYFGAWQLEDWTHVLQCLPRWNFHGITLGVHRGFAKLAERAIKMLPDLPAYRLTGHSMGGAIALLVGYYLYRKGKAVTVETAGCPRTVYKWATKHFGSIPITRYVTIADPVQHLPPFLDHVGTKTVLIASETGIEAHEPAVYKRHLPWVLYPEDCLQK